MSQLLGSLNWASGLIPLGRLYLRPLQRHFHSLGLTDRFTPPRPSDPLVLANLLPHQLSGVQSGCFCPAALGSSASGPPGYDRHGQFDSSFIYQQAGRDSLPHLAALNCQSFPRVRVSEHNSPGKTHSRLSERDSRPPISSKPANTDRVVPTPRDLEPYLQGLADSRNRHVCNTVELPPSSVHVSSSGAKSPSGGCSVSGLALEVNVHVSPIPPA